MSVNDTGVRQVPRELPSRSPLSLREAARLAQVSRALPPELQRAGLIGPSVTLEDVLVIRAFAGVPSRWLRPIDSGTPASLQASDVSGAVQLSCNRWRSGSDQVVVVTETWATAVPRADLPRLVEAAESAVVVLPTDRWLSELASAPAVDAQEVAVGT